VAPEELFLQQLGDNRGLEKKFRDGERVSKSGIELGSLTGR
jgi:hypothetical protein